MPYVEYTKVQQDESPWELQTMKIKTSPDILRNVNLINNSDRDILKNILRNNFIYLTLYYSRNIIASIVQ